MNDSQIQTIKSSYAEQHGILVSQVRVTREIEKIREGYDDDGAWYAEGRTISVRVDADGCEPEVCILWPR